MKEINKEIAAPVSRQAAIEATIARMQQGRLMKAYDNKQAKIARRKARNQR